MSKSVADTLEALLAGFKDNPAPPSMLREYTFTERFESRGGKSGAVRPSSLGKHVVSLQLAKLGFTKPEVLTPWSLMNLYRGLTLELPLLEYLRSGFPGSRVQVPLEIPGFMRGTADMVADGTVLDLKCSMGSSWDKSPAYVRQLSFYSQVANGLTKSAFIVNYDGIKLDAVELSPNRLKRAWTVVQEMVNKVAQTTCVEEVISDDNPDWNSLPQRVNPAFAWTLNSKGLGEYYHLFWKDSILLPADRALTNLLKEYSNG